MSNVTILFRARVHAEVRSTILDAIEKVARLTREEEPCRAYTCYVTDGSQVEILVLQTWDTLKAFEAHTRSSVVAELFDRYERHLLEPVQRMILTPTHERVTL